MAKKRIKIEELLARVDEIEKTIRATDDFETLARLKHEFQKIAAKINKRLETPGLIKRTIK